MNGGTSTINPHNDLVVDVTTTRAVSVQQPTTGIVSFLTEANLGSVLISGMMISLGESKRWLIVWACLAVVWVVIDVVERRAARHQDRATNNVVETKRRRR